MLKSLVTQLRKCFRIPHECHMGNPPIITITPECLGKSCEQICLTNINDMQAKLRGQVETPQRVLLLLFSSRTAEWAATLDQTVFCFKFYCSPGL